MEKEPKISTARIIFQLILVVIVIPMLPILITWRWGWWEAWVLFAILFLGFVLSRLLAARKHPGILAERAASMGKEDTEPWDKFLAPFLALGGLVVPLIAGLDERFNWSPQPFSMPLKCAAIAVLVLGYAFSSWAMIENAWFSGVVRLQTDRSQAVCSTGPYRFIRHPGYAGALWAYLAMPLLLDTSWAFIPAAILLIAMFVRTHLEDKTLQEELPGYREYAQVVRYRLFPGLW
jgi:protein-S-isoprenylcysteine O-methyltransferase Ste14